MPRRKAPENETEQEREVRHIKETISSAANRSEKTSWNRKMDNMVSLMAKLQPIEDQIIELQSQKLPILDDINELRQMMLKECVHPYEYLVVDEDHVTCKFCNKRMRLPNVNTDEET